METVRAPLLTAAALCGACPDACRQACARCGDIDACVKAGGICMARRTDPVPFYKDVGDRGFDPFTAACFEVFGDPMCSERAVSLQADFCCQGTLFEHIASTCTPTPAFKGVDCAAACRERGSSGGSCEPTADPCEHYPEDRPAPPPGAGRCVCNKK